MATVAGCAGVSGSPPPSAIQPSATSVSLASPSAGFIPSPSPSAFPIAVFAGMSLEPLTGERTATYQAILADIADGGGIAATVMAAEGTWSGAAGKADGLHDVQVDSQFGIASITKSVVAAQVMRLVESGEVSLDEPATDYLPGDFAFDTNGATIRQLLSMRSGIPDWYGPVMEKEVATHRKRVWTTAEVLALVDPARRPAGSEFKYADTNYILLGLVIEHVRHRPLVDVLREGVLRVEGTKRLIYQPAEAPTDPMAMPLAESRNVFEKSGGYLP